MASLRFSMTVGKRMWQGDIRGWTDYFSMTELGISDTALGLLANR